ncbi:MAG TPA: hypothetical protein VFY90_03445 [Tepidiformaceae bacterium]|nr:hypothetical protein [Tepidiformaceae bacterium]
MKESNLFTMLSAYRPGSPATPFENYCTSGLAYFLQGGHHMLSALFAAAARADGEALAIVEVQPQVAGAGIADLVLTFEGGRRAIVEVQVEANADESALPALESAGGSALTEEPVYLLLGLDSQASGPWTPITWLQIVEALEDDPDPVAKQYAEFVLRDILGLGPVPLDQAITTNRLYALGAAAIRRRFGERAGYVNSASRPLSGRYRYLGTTFSLDGGDMQYWIGLVNETVPLSEHYHLLLASKEAPVRQPAEHPRATGDWKWAHWTGVGRVVRPITAEAYDELLARLPA